MGGLVSIFRTVFNYKPQLRIKELSEFATLPTWGSKDAAGLDLYAAHDYVVKAGENEMIKTDLQIELPPGCYGRVASRSGLSWKHRIEAGAGVIDRDYRGPLNVVLNNLGKQDFEIKRGDRVAQLICERIERPNVQRVKDLESTKRGTQGFGSTGV